MTDKISVSITPNIPNSWEVVNVVNVMEEYKRLDEDKHLWCWFRTGPNEYIQLITTESELIHLCSMNYDRTFFLLPSRFIFENDRFVFKRDQ